MSLFFGELKRRSVETAAVALVLLASVANAFAKPARPSPATLERVIAIVEAAPPLSLPFTYCGDVEFVNANDPDGYRLKFSKDARELRLVAMGMMTLVRDATTVTLLR